jgi:hypothetical protein
MKKAVAVLVAVISALTIVLVAFFGTNPVGIEPIIYIQSLEVLDMNGHSFQGAGDGVPTLEVDFQADDKDAEGKDVMSYWFDVRILPTNATSREVLFYSAPDPYITFAGGAADATLPEGAETGKQISHSGALVIRSLAKSDPNVDVYHPLKIHCQADDGGPAEEDVIYFVVKY